MPDVNLCVAPKDCSPIKPAPLFIIFARGKKLKISHAHEQNHPRLERALVMVLANVIKAMSFHQTTGDRVQRVRIGLGLAFHAKVHSLPGAFVAVSLQWATISSCSRSHCEAT